ncbi:hypothetical protein [Providencia huaxiensis]|uniref:hypothetical protein n=1 Tax=Providencia huaxiensis TaxID=2027290 RepID=UPI0024AC8093|nr:hypothetical protein [Providencia rettgeri]ELR5137629.1 hypothetical protein [Providencia rettgeri]ELR5255014.1 hypothetical protein [Providencia rettgeri]EMB0753454.1 hypothetical protein [Providencia rettgeri]MBZ3681074.1 hypothetical protein [Providencia rettgeri]
MGKTIFRMINGRIVPMVVDEETIGDPSQYTYKQTPKHPTTERKLSDKAAFVIPNAVCLSCGKDVFYYENSFGSRVLFDSLGPPWPIHPCYSNYVEKKNNTTPYPDKGWQPIIIDKAIITSSGGLRVQGMLENKCVRFFFDEKTFSRMRMSIDDAQNIIAYGSLEKGLVETHNGKKVFSSKYQQIANGENKSENIIKANDENIQKSLEYTAQKRVLNDEFVMLEIYFCGDIKSQMIFKVDDFNKYFKGMHVFKLKRTKQHNEIMFSCKSTSQGISIMLNVLAIGVNHLDDSLRDENINHTSKDNMRFVGILSVSEIRYLDDTEQQLILRGTLNKRFKLNYLIDDIELAKFLYDKYGNLESPTKIKSIIVMDNEESIELNIYNDQCAPFRVKYLADKVIWKIDKVKRLKELALLEEQEKAKTIEDQISRLSSEISTAMADAFASAKKRK